MNARAIGILAAGLVSMTVLMAPTPSTAHPVLVPIIIGAVIVGGAIVVASAAHAAHHHSYHRGSVSVGPDRELECRSIRVRTSGGAFRHRQVCN
jgi:hypothetical protein